jgi:murein DD-endopeptidase MepM/ murein hydrolase activator NlpD
MQGYKNSLNFKNDIRKGDKLAMIYEQKYRLSQPFSMPILKASVIEMHKKKHFIYLNDDDRYYDEKGKQVEGFLLAKPVRNARITSRFTRRRWHPILHKYRAHLGVDYGARRGTPIYAAGSGRVVFAGYTRGYGKVIKIRHSDGYMTLYAHQKKFKRGIRRGKYVKRGQVIGYVGSTGLSTGPHLHFGLYKNGRAINPLRVVQVTVRQLKGKKLKAFKKLKANYDESLELHLKNNTPFEKDNKFSRVCYVYNPHPYITKESDEQNKNKQNNSAGKS